jgi:dTDP-4-dehydrorhamnose 3,5-epimerase
VNFQKTPIPGGWVIEAERLEDDRGFFARTWCRRELEQHGLVAAIAQCSVSFNRRKGTLRGLHYQFPHAEAKLVRCTRGGIFDVMVDLRRDSPSYLDHFSAMLTAENRTQLYIPEGCAHGFLTLEDDTEILYQISEFFYPNEGHGVRWNDPKIGIRWPFEPAVMSDRDRNFPDLVP